MVTRTQQLGRLGEDYAAGWLQARGWHIMDRNVRYACGEIDLIAFDDDTVVFVEVKTRRSADFGAAEAVTPRKLARIRTAAAQWLRERPIGHLVPVRFDVIEVIGQPSSGEELSVTHYEDVNDGAW